MIRVLISFRSTHNVVLRRVHLGWSELLFCAEKFWWGSRMFWNFLKFQDLLKRFVHVATLRICVNANYELTQSEGDCTVFKQLTPNTG